MGTPTMEIVDFFGGGGWNSIGWKVNITSTKKGTLQLEGINRKLFGYHKNESWKTVVLPTKLYLLSPKISQVGHWLSEAIVLTNHGTYQETFNNTWFSECEIFWWYSLCLEMKFWRISIYTLMYSKIVSCHIKSTMSYEWSFTMSRSVLVSWFNKRHSFGS